MLSPQTDVYATESIEDTENITIFISLIVVFSVANFKFDHCEIENVVYSDS
jgi:hypothetical protein